MWPFTKPVAKIYVNELRTLDTDLVPIFTPDTEIGVGDVGSFEDGRFVRYFNLADRGIALDVLERTANPFEFASQGKVSVGPSVDVPNPLGGTLSKMVLSFTGSKALVAAYAEGVDRSVRDADAFRDDLLRLWSTNEIRKDRCVVWSVRQASGGTIVVSEKADNQVEVLADTALLGGAGLTLRGLSVGVRFGTERSATWKISGGKAPLVIGAKLFALSADQREVLDRYGFEATQVTNPVKPIPYTADDLLQQLE
jgi:hypothetical protein